jgi:hypothetical protein
MTRVALRSASREPQHEAHVLDGPAVQAKHVWHATRLDESRAAMKMQRWFVVSEYLGVDPVQSVLSHSPIDGRLHELASDARPSIRFENADAHQCAMTCGILRVGPKPNVSADLWRPVVDPDPAPRPIAHIGDQAARQQVPEASPLIHHAGRPKRKSDGRALAVLAHLLF